VIITPTSNVAARLTDEIGSSQANAAQGRTLLGTSGRAQAWVGALHTAAERPVAGYGFGTEDRVFVDRWFSFEGDRPENSYIGIFLQLGVVGLALLIGIGIALIAAGRRALHSTSNRALGAACFGVVAAGATLSIAQSYVYAVGDIGTLAFWSMAFVLAGLAGPGARRRA
jgi:O-antigen ligase